MAFVMVIKMCFSFLTSVEAVKSYVVFCDGVLIDEVDVPAGPLLLLPLQHLHEVGHRQLLS